MVCSIRLCCCTFVAVLFSIVLPANGQDGAATERLYAILDAEWERTLRESPTFASSLGDRRFNDEWPDMSLEAIERRHAAQQAVLKQLADIDAQQLSPADQLNYTLFRKQYETDIAGHRFQWYQVPLNQREGIQDENSLSDSLPFTKVKDYDDWIARCRAIPLYIDQTIALMRAGMQSGMLQPKIVMQRVSPQIARQIVNTPEESLYFKPFRSFPDDIPQAEQVRITRDAKQAIGEYVVPAYQKFAEFFDKEYYPACFDEVGAWQMPNGQEFYAHRARLFTTTDLTPRQIHEIGLSEVRRIRGEMEAIVKQVGFKGTFKEFL